VKLLYISLSKLIDFLIFSTQGYLIRKVSKVLSTLIVSILFVLFLTIFLTKNVCFRFYSYYIEIAYTLLYKSQSSLNYVLTYKMSQDHLELFFGCVRAYSGSNLNNNLFF